MLFGLPRQFWAGICFFFIFGMAFGVWGAHIPSVEDRMGDRETALGIALFCAAVGLLISAPLAGPLSKRLSTARLIVLCWVVYLISMSGVFWATSLYQLGACLLLVGLMGGLIDVAINAQIAITERQMGLNLLSRAHAIWSFGGVVGAGTGIGFLALGLRGEHIVASLGVMGLISLWASFNLYGREHETSATPRPHPAENAGAARGADVRIWTNPTLLLMGLLAMLGLIIESGIMEWMPIYFSDYRGTDPAGSATVFTFFSAVMFITRMFGDELKKHMREKHILVGGALLSGVALLAGLHIPDNFTAIVVMSVAGIGIAYVYPLVTSRAAAYRAPGQSDASAAGNIAVVTGVGYAAILISPPIIGSLSEYVSHHWGMMFVMACGPVLALLALFLPKQRKPQQQ